VGGLPPGGGGGTLPPVGGGNGGREFPPGDPRNAPSAQTGGRITESGLAEVHRGELVTDPDRLVSDLAEAVNRAGGGGGDGTQRLESKLDQVNRNLRRLESVLSNLTIEADGEAIGRVAQEGQRDRINDTDPLA
jgi:hypothetical protein